MPKVRWVVSHRFCSKFHTFQQCKNFENRLRFEKVTESLKLGTFLRHSVYAVYIIFYILFIIVSYSVEYTDSVVYTQLL